MTYIKKRFVVAVTGLILLAIAVCNASPRYGNIPKVDIAIGGITIGATESYVREIYGEPDEIYYESNERRAGSINRKTFRYGTSFFVIFNTDNNSNKVWEVKSAGNNGLTTPVGFTVGMNLSDVREYYGQGRGDNNHLAYTADRWYNIMFTAKNGKITEIRIYPTP